MSEGNPGGSRISSGGDTRHAIKEKLMPSLRSLIVAAGAAVLPALVASTAAQAHDVYVDVYRPRPVYVAPAPRVVVVAPGSNCVVRKTRVWVGDHYAYRKVKRCY
jgi:hypothetical protein